MTPVPDPSCATWRKSTRSSGNGECVEVAKLHRLIGVRDSKNPNGPVLTWSNTTWQSFYQAAKAGDYDLR